jgi:PEP-CTERM motif
MTVGNFVRRMVGGLLGFVLATTPALAQTAPTSRTLNLTFTGVVSNTATNTIRIRQPDGSYVPYTGPVPEFPYAQDAPVSVSFNAVVPTKAFYDTTYQGQLAADGIYRIRVTTPSSGSGQLLGNATAADISGPIRYSPNYGEPPYTGMTVVYDYNADTYSIEGSGGFGAGNLWGAGFVFDAATGQLTGCQTFQCAPLQYDYNSYFLGSDSSGTQLMIRNAGIYNPVNGDSRAGLWDMMFSGSWNLPQFGGGGVIQVPEPGMLGLFGGATIALAFARRRRRKVAGAA